MFKVLLVDDEPFVIEGLKVMVDWEKHGFSICGEATNGEDALEIIKACNPHLVVTDLNMPVMDGLQLIKTVVEALSLRSKFIILSGYDDFSYAQTAMRYNVSSYVLKPIDDEVMDQVLGKVREEIQQELQLKSSTERELALVAQNTIARLLVGETKESVLKRAGFLLGIEDTDDIRCVLVEMDNYEKWAEGLGEKDARLQRDELRRAIDAALSGDYPLHIFQNGAGRFGVVLCGRMLSNDNIKCFISNLKSTVVARECCKASIFVSGKQKGIASLHKCYRQALKARVHRFFLGEGCVIFYEDLKKMPVSHEICDSDIDGLMQDIECNHVDSVNKKVNDIFRGFSRSRLAPESVKIYINNLELELVKLVLKISGNTEEYTLQRAWTHFDINNTTLDEMEICVGQLCVYTAGFIAGVKEKNPKDLVFAVKEYVNRNYSSDLKIQKIAEQFHINPVYLGQLFKKNTGMQFNEYLNAVRIEEARRLLRRADMKISDIACSVGYKDQDYFISKFKSITGCLPSEFKKSCGWKAAGSTGTAKGRGIGE